MNDRKLGYSPRLEFLSGGIMVKCGYYSIEVGGASAYGALEARGKNLFALFLREALLDQIVCIA